MMKWSNLKGQKWGAVTLPLMHDGEFYNTELKVVYVMFVKARCHGLQRLMILPFFNGVLQDYSLHITLT